MIPARMAPILFGLILSGIMSLIVSGVAMLRTHGLSDGFFGLWMAGWLPSWLVAFPVVLVIAPFTRRVVGKLVRTD
jgi:hypothetical protein